MEFVFLALWVLSGALIGLASTPIVYSNKGHNPASGAFTGLIVGAVGNLVLLAPLWVLLPDHRHLRDREDLPQEEARLGGVHYLIANILRPLEAGIVGVFFVQAVRFVYATVYAHASSADLVQRSPNIDSIRGVPGFIEANEVRYELIVLAAMLLLPLLALIIGRWRLSFPVAVLLVAMGRSAAVQTPDFAVEAGALVLGGSLLYFALTIIRRPTTFPAAMLIGLAGDQLVRAAGDTLDRTWNDDYTFTAFNRLDVQMGVLIANISIFVIILSLLVWYLEKWEAREPGYNPPQRGLLNMWGGLALGALFYLEFTSLGLPNVIARLAETPYTGIVPWLLTATVLPLVPEVRDIARRFAGMFDGAWRGWLWMLLLGLLLVVGRAYHGLMAGIALVCAQFMVGLTLWWLIPTGAPRRNFTGFTILFSLASFLVLTIGDNFTYDYAYVRDFAAPYQHLDEFLRAFRGMGLALTLIAALLLSTPIILARKWIPWRGGRPISTLATLALVLAVSFAGAAFAGTDPVQRPSRPDCLRTVTFNLHGGYSQYFDPNLERAADLILANGADIVLLQEVETGRLASFGVDQVLWLSRRLEMESAYFPQNESLQGLAVLSRVPIDDVEGLLLPSEGNQAAVMHVSLDPEKFLVDPTAAEMGDLHVYNAWLGFRVAEKNGQPVPEEEQDQRKQLNTMMNWIAARHAPDWKGRIILGGTFNYAPDPASALYGDLYKMGLQDPFASLPLEEANTVYLVNGSAARYDYLWVFNLPLSKAMVDQSQEAADASDHRSGIVEVGRRPGLVCPS